MTAMPRKITDEENRVRFVVGIDLGTTNCACSFVDLERVESGESAVPETFLIPQAVAPNAVESRDVLPSFFARLSSAPFAPWEDSSTRRDISLKGRGTRSPKDGKYGVVGTLARDYGAIESDSFVSSAKSWLCHSGVDRTAAILPWNVQSSSESSEDEIRKRWSPVEVSSFYLGHIRAAWNSRYPEYPLETQDVVLTIPASFDETARTLTLDAAKLAGLSRVALVEEPQAAFYSWLAKHENDWTEYVRPGQKILVCDVGGGTTDFALIYALERENADSEAAAPRAKSVKFYRVAVGDHLVLGGDNLDLALARLLESKALALRSAPLTTRERSTLLKEARDAKEYFLGADETTSETRRIVLPAVGSKLVGGALTVELTRTETENLLVDGFFPKVEATSAPVRRRSGLREIALPYASDSAVTKYLAYFLSTHKDADKDLERAGVLGGIRSSSSDTENERAVDVVLFNGGAFESPKLRSRVVENLASWQGGAEPTVLQNENLYLAVARGAAYYGLVLRGHGSRIGASLARTYYVGVELGGEAKNKRRKAVCLLPSQCEPGDEIVLEKTFELAVDRPVSFPLFVSSVRTVDAPGDLIEVDPNETRELSPIRTALKTRSRAKKEAKTIRAKLVARPTEIGTIELFLQEVLPENADSRSRASRWTLQFDARGGAQSDWEAGSSEGEEEGVVDESLVENARNALRAAFAPDSELGELARIKPRELLGKITEGVGVSKNEIPVTTLRRLAESTLELADGRKLSAAVEARWLNWLGFALRPGFGVSADDWRVEQAWKTIGGRLAFNTPEVRAQYWILWRRVASGLTAGRQLTLVEPIAASIRALRKQLVEGRGKGPDWDLTSQDGVEIWRMLGAFELLPIELKEELGDAILDVLPKKKTRPIRETLVWTLGRVGARTLFHAPLDRVVSPTTAARWTTRLLDDLARLESEPTHVDFFALAQLVRMSEDAAFNVDAALREKVGAYLVKHGVEESVFAALERRSRAFAESATEIFGEELPLGLRWE